MGKRLRKVGGLRRWAQTVPERPRAEQPRLTRLAAKAVLVLPMVARWDVVKRLQLHAQALTYDTLLALVPLLVVVFAAVSGFGGGVEQLRGQLESVIIANISGTDAMRATVAEYLHDFLANVRTGSISAVAVVLLIYSTTSLLGHIEYAINSVFGIKGMRPWLARLVTYWAVLTLGPLLMLASFAMTAAFQTTGVATIVHSKGLSGLLLTLLPLTVTWVAFLCMYLVVPRVRVRFSSALFGAIVAGSLWSVAKYGYAIYAKNAVTIQNIYGSLAIIPLFILWVYVSWLLVLVGAQLAFAYQNAATFEKEELARKASPAYRARVACRLFLEVAKDFLAGRPPTEPERVSHDLEIPRRLLEMLATDLKAGGYLREVEGAGLVPAKDLERVSIGDILDLLLRGEPGELKDGGAGSSELDPVFAELDKERARVAGTLSFRELAERSLQQSAPPSPPALEQQAR